MSKSLVFALVGASFTTVACKNNDPPPAPAVAASAVAVVVEAGPTSVKYAIDPTGKTSIDMPAPSEHIKGATDVAGGELVIDTKRLAETRGQVKADVTTLTTTTFGIEDKDKAQTEHARNWLEAGTLVTPEVKEGNRWAIYTIKSVEGLASSDLSTVPIVHLGPEDTRTVTARANGDFFVHGHQIAKSAELEIVFHYATGEASAAKPTTVEIKTKTPLHVTLAEHEVKPRDSFGAIAQKSFSLIGTKVAETADVTFDLTARPAH
jgi:hypothetical protein